MLFQLQYNEIVFFFRSKKFPYMPLSAVPYKLSITYIHLFLSRYQYPIFHSSHQRLQSILAEKQKNDLDGQGNNPFEVRIYFCIITVY